MNYTVGMVLLGCAKNRVDGEIMLNTLKRANFKIVDEIEFCDAIIINTCGFIESAKQESINEILEVIQLKKENKVKSIIVTGCLAQRYKEEILKQLPEVNAVVGIGANKNIDTIVKNSLNNLNTKQEEFPSKTLLPLEGERLQSTPHHQAYLKISEGCSNKCTYCAIPAIRGNFRSRKMENIIEEAKSLVNNGVKEITLIAQDTTKYGEDIYGKLMLPELLTELCKIENLKWIRLLYCYPDKITDELIDVIKNEEKIVKYMDIPIQHCNSRILKAMNRKGNKEDLENLITKIRREIPNIVLRTTLIAGFPSETEEEFEELSEFVNNMKFERLGCFAYSKEENTPAAIMKDQIDEDIKEKRAEIINNQQQIIMDKYCDTLLNKTVTVLVEGFDSFAECFYGRGHADAPEVDGFVFFYAKKEKPDIGSMVKVKIKDFFGCDPIGNMVE